MTCPRDWPHIWCVGLCFWRDLPWRGGLRCCVAESSTWRKPCDTLTKHSGTQPQIAYVDISLIWHQITMVLGFSNMLIFTHQLSIFLCMAFFYCKFGLVFQVKNKLNKTGCLLMFLVLLISVLYHCDSDCRWLSCSLLVIYFCVMRHVAILCCRYG